MDIEQFEILEQKVLKLIERINELEMENKELIHKSKILITKIEEKENMIQNLQENNKSNMQLHNEIETYKKNENKVKSKVESLLMKLKEFDEL